MDAKYPVVMDSRLWAFAMEEEPITHILYEHEHYDFLKGTRVESDRNSAFLETAYLYSDGYFKK